MTTASVLSSLAASDDLVWSERFDRAQAEFRRRNGRPAASVTIAPLAADPTDLRNLDCYRDGWDAGIAAARLAKITASVAETDAALASIDVEPAITESFSDELLSAVSACNECNPADEPTGFGYDEDERSEDRYAVTEEAKPSPADLLKPITFYPLNHPVRRADADDLARAFEVGHSLGSEGWNARDVAPCSIWTAAEANAFHQGIEAGYDRLMDGVALDVAELVDREATMAVLYAEANDGELMAGTLVGHVA
jgi:hypothetical protein